MRFGGNALRIKTIYSFINGLFYIKYNEITSLVIIRQQSKV